jgi:hypothetical protein
MNEFREALMKIGEIKGENQNGGLESNGKMRKDHQEITFKEPLS